jgi:hypothetical protein
MASSGTAFYSVKLCLLACGNNTDRRFMITELTAIFGSQREDVTGGWRKFHNGGFVICIDPVIILGRINQSL